MNNLHEDRMRDQEWSARQDRIAQWKEEQAMRKSKTTTTETTGQARHTPGPWKHEYAGLIYANCHRNSPVAKASQADLHGRSQAEALANARLIAAAPSLLEACKRALSIADAVADLRAEDVGRAFAQSVANELDAVIARVEGGAS